MITVKEAFSKFRSRLELSDAQKTDVSRRQKEIRANMADSFQVADDFLAGSYRRHTATKPLGDVDIFCILGPDEDHYRREPPRKLLDAVADAMRHHYDSVEVDPRCVTIKFERPPNLIEDDYVLGFDIVPSFEKPKYYEIPDATTGDWIRTDVKAHDVAADRADKAYNDQWKLLVRMAKMWNRTHEKVVKPSFLIEVMALDLLVPKHGGDNRREMQALFATMSQHLRDEWPDPAGVGPQVNTAMDGAALQAAETALRLAERACMKAIRMEAEGNVGGALRVWHDDVFGPYFPLS